MRFNEFYYTLSGEGISAGLPVSIVRLQGCNLKCKYCDTQYAWDPEGGKATTVSTLVEKNTWRGRVLITGGEPLLQSDSVHELVTALKLRGVTVEVETNGSFPPPTWWREVDCWSADMKCPSSGMMGRSQSSWLGTRKQDQVKFVVSTEEDLTYALRTARCIGKDTPTVLISPTYPWTSAWVQRCAYFCLNQGARLSLQLHKIVWGERRGT